MTKHEARVRLVDDEGAEVIVPEQGLVRITGTFKDETNTPVPSASWVSLTLTLYEKTGLVNLVDPRSVLNAGGMTLHATDGSFVLILQGADHRIVDSTVDLEPHRALIEGVYASTKPFKFEIDFAVRNLNKVS